MPGIEGIEVAAGAPARPVTRTLGVLPRPLTARLLAPRLIPLALALITFLVFMPALWGGFVAWDDQVNLYDNPEYRGLTWPQIRWMFSNVTMGHWIPLTWLTFGLDFVLWGMNPFGYHLTSLVVFAANAPALYFVARRLLRSATSFDEATLTVSAVAATLFFALHPLRAESVAWATERRDVLSGLFFLLTVLLYLKAHDHVGARRRWLLVGSVGLYLLALVSKASVMVLPAALVVLDVYPLRRLGGRWRDWVGPAARTVWLEKVPFAVLGAAGAAVTYYAQNANLFITPLERYPLAARPAMVFYSLWFYLEKTLMPWGLSPLYELPAKVSLLDRQFLIPALAVTALTTTLVLLRRRSPAGLAVWIYYAIALGPVIGIVHSGHQLTNDRYSYLPGIGLAVLLGGAVGAVLHAGAAGVLRPSLAKVVLGLGVIWLGGLAYLSTQQAQVWRDTENLWRYAIEVDPDCAICHGNLGVHFAQQGYYQLAKAEFDQVLALRPDGKKAHLQLGYLYATRGNFPRAVDHFQQYVERFPNDVEGLNNLGVALVNARRTKEALVHLHRGLRIQPRHAQLHVSLAYAYRDLGDLPRAMSLYRDAVKLKYDMPQAWFGIARVNLESGNRDAAHKAWGLLGQLEPGLAGQIGPLFLETW
ncbi:MAG TPA: tetratricopeptide repeat protein [Methylomirabilota bacterium]|nr:tetratricopeptide repeat protein [Methylomirabilota bacterium]